MKLRPTFNLLVIVLLPMIGQAQTPDIRFGFEFSPFVSWLSSDFSKVKNDGSNLGYQLMINGEYLFRKQYALRAGLGISFRNGGKLLHVDGGTVLPKSELTKEDFRMLGPNAPVRYKLQYVEIPVSFRMYTQEIGYARFYVEIPVLTTGFCTQARGDLFRAEGNNENISKDTQWLNLSWGVGAGAEYGLSSSTFLTAGLYFQQGITDVVSKTDANRGKNELNKLVLRLGLMF